MLNAIIVSIVIHSTNSLIFIVKTRVYNLNRQRKNLLGWIPVIVEVLGEIKCNRCGYNKHYGALDFHHKNPEEKEMLVSSVLGHWAATLENREKVTKELKKCEILCANCHREHHSHENLFEYLQDGQ